MSQIKIQYKPIKYGSYFKYKTLKLDPSGYHLYLDFDNYVYKIGNKVYLKKFKRTNQHL